MASGNVPAVLRWRSSGRLPQPDFIFDSGRVHWLEDTIASPLDEVDWASCPRRGARLPQRATTHSRCSQPA
jgi:hypothetical protein